MRTSEKTHLATHPHTTKPSKHKNNNTDNLHKTFIHIPKTMSDQPPNLAELFTNLLNTADANTRAAIFLALQTQPPTNNVHAHSYVDDIAASIHDINSTTIVPANNTPTPQTPLATNNTTNPTTPFATNNITTGSTTSTSNNLDYDDPEDNFILSQSEVAPRIHNTHSTNHIISSSGLFTTLLEDQRAAHHDDLQLQTRRMTEGRVYNYNDAHVRKHIIIKIAINTTANSDQAPTTSILEEVIDTIINSLTLSFPVDIVSIINYSQPIDNVKRTSSTYYSFAFISPRSTQKRDGNFYSLEYSYLYTRLADLLKGPTQALHNIHNLPTITRFLNITTPNINSMNERLEFLIEGIGPRSLLGQEEYENSDTFRHLGFLIFFALRACWKQNMPITHPFPPELAKYMTRNEIMHIISTKKVRMRTPENTPKIHNILGIIITTTDPQATALRDAIHELCINKQNQLFLFGPHNNFTINLHTFPPNNDPTRFALGKKINSSNHQLHIPSQFKIFRNVRIHPNFLRQHKNITQATLSLDNCIAIFCDFSHGHGDLQLTTIFNADRTTNYLNPDTITSLIVNHLSHILDLKPSSTTSTHTNPSTTSPTRQSYATATSHNPYATTRNPGPPFPALNSPSQGRGRGRGRGHQQDAQRPFLNTNNQITIADRSPGHLRAPINNLLNFNLTPSKRFHALINAAGGIATAGIYNLNFDQGGLRHLTAGVSYAIHQAYDTWEQAFAQVCHFYPHIKTKDDINNMNTNCCHDTSNLNNPSPAISHCVGPYPNSSTHHKECYYYVELNTIAQTSRMNATKRRISQGRFITDSYTFDDNEIGITNHNQQMEDSSMISTGPTHPPLHIDVQVPNTFTTHPPPPTHQNNESTNDNESTNESIIAETASYSSHDLLSYQTQVSQTQQLSQTSDNPSPLKRRHTRNPPPTPPHYIQFSVPIKSNVSNITSTLLHELESTDLPPEYISHNLSANAPTHPTLLNQKLVFVEILHTNNRQYTSILINVITNTWPDSFPTHTSTPPTKQHEASICLKTIPTTNWARYCQLSTCTMYNNGHPFIQDTDEGLLSLEIHTQQLHSNIFLKLPKPILNSIGWTRCCDKCPELFLGISENIKIHQQSCPIYITLQQQTHTSSFDFSTNPDWALAFAICPPTHTNDLNNLINDYPDDISTEEALQPILMTVSQWCYDAKSPSYGTNPPKANTTTTATTIITKANTPPHETTTITTPTTFQHETTTTALATISPTTVTTTATNHNPND